MRSLLLLLVTISACASGDQPAWRVDLSRGPGDPSPVVSVDGDVIFERASTGGPGLRGPGGPAVAFEEDDLLEHCAYLEGGENDFDHHNLVVPYRGHLVMPWSPEFGTGGLSFFDMSDPCAPVKAGEGFSASIRETHALGFVHLPASDPHAGDWVVVNMFGGAGNSGIQFWDIADVEAPVSVADLPLDGVFYPDSYNLISLSVFWQYPYVYVAAANNGVFVVDATDPLMPEAIAHFVFPNGFRAGGVFALGNTLLVTSAEEKQAAVLDISDPAAPALLPGSPFSTADRDGVARESYHGNRAGHLAMFARKEGGGGPIVYDISDPTQPTFVTDLPTPGSGGYVFYDEGFLFTGDSSLAHIVDVRDWSAPVLHATTDLGGDLDTNTPYGNVAILAVDSLEPPDGQPGQATAVVPWSLEVDVAPIEILGLDPQDGSVGVATTGRVGVGFNEFVEPASAFPGSLRLWTAEGQPVPGWVSTQEATVSFTPKEPLLPNTTYTLEVVAGGVADINGNALATTSTTTFTTAP